MPDQFARLVACNLRYAVAANGCTLASLAQEGGWHRRTLERWLDPEHPSMPNEGKRKVLETLLGRPWGWLAAEHQEVQYT